jgi:phage tail-like protein
MSDAPATTATPPGAAPGVFVDPYLNYNYKVIVPGLAEAHFTECTGLAARVTPITYKEGGTTQPHRIPGPVDYAEVTLRYGLTNSRQLWDWFQTAVTGKVQRQNVSIVVLDADGFTPRVQWDLIRAWPTEWRGAPLDALAAEIAIETLSLVFEDLRRV